MKLGSLNPSRVLGVPSLYRLLGTMFGRTRQWQMFARDYVGAQPGDRILDVGCGPADVLTELPPDIDYTGFDQSEDYIDSARRRYGVRGQFFAGKVDLAHIDRLGAGSFDIVIAHGLLHHLDDRQATEFFALARAGGGSSQRTAAILTGSRVLPVCSWIWTEGATCAPRQSMWPSLSSLSRRQFRSCATIQLTFPTHSCI